MQALTAALAVFATVAAAFTLPSDLQNGVYHAYYDKDGREVHELVQALEPGNSTLRRGITDSEEPSLAKRLPGTPLLEYSCGCGFTLDHGDCDNSVTGLKNFLNDHETTQTGCYDLVPESSAYCYVNSVVTFLCNWSTEYGVCSSDVGNSLAAVTNHCGWYIAGTEAAAAWFPDLDGSVTIDSYYFTGYMRYSAGLDFCGADFLAGDNEHC